LQLITLKKGPGKHFHKPSFVLPPKRKCDHLSGIVIADDLVQWEIWLATREEFQTSILTLQRKGFTSVLRSPWGPHHLVRRRN